MSFDPPILKGRLSLVCNTCLMGTRKESVCTFQIVGESKVALRKELFKTNTWQEEQIDPRGVWEKKVVFLPYINYVSFWLGVYTPMFFFFSAETQQQTSCCCICIVCFKKTKKTIKYWCGKSKVSTTNIGLWRNTQLVLHPTTIWQKRHDTLAKTCAQLSSKKNYLFISFHNACNLIKIKRGFLLCVFQFWERRWNYTHGLIHKYIN